MIYITEVHMVGGDRHEHIAAVRWRNPEDGSVGENTREGMVDWIQRGGDARVADAWKGMRVRVVHETPKYLRTYSNGQWTDNLLALPRY